MKHLFTLSFIRELVLWITDFPFYYWRTSNKTEVDFVLEFADKLIPIEVKSGIQVKKQSIQGIKDFAESQKHKSVSFSIVFYGGDEVYLIDSSTIAIPLKNLLL